LYTQAKGIPDMFLKVIGRLEEDFDKKGPFQIQPFLGCCCCSAFLGCALQSCGLVAPLYQLVLLAARVPCSAPASGCFQRRLVPLA
jgi:hypothetical protein